MATAKLHRQLDCYGPLRFVLFFLIAASKPRPTSSIPLPRPPPSPTSRSQPVENNDNDDNYNDNNSNDIIDTDNNNYNNNRALDRVFLNRALKTMGIYQSALMNLYWPPMVQCMTIWVALAYMFKKRAVDKDLRYGFSYLTPWNPRASAKGRVPIHWMAVFSGWDQLNATVQAVSQAYISNAMQTAINNTVVIWTLVIAFFYLGSRFRQVHYAASLLIVMSCIVGVVVELQDGTMPKPVSPTNVPVDVAVSTSVLMYAIYIIGVVPQGIGNCYKQKVLKGVDLDVIWSFVRSGMFQVLWGLLGYTTNWIPYPVPGGHTDAWICFMGSNPHPGHAEGDTCTTDSAWLWFCVYLCFNVTFNLLFLWRTKHLSATWASIGNVLTGDLYGVFGHWGFINGSGSKLMPLASEATVQL